MAATSTAPRGRRRWVWGALIGLAVLAVVVRLAVPVVVRGVLLRRAAVLRARVDVTAVDVSLLARTLTLHGLTVRSATPPERGPDDPVLSCRRVTVRWRWRPLLARRVRLARIDLDGPRLALDRLADGGLNLAALLPEHPVVDADGVAPAPAAPGAEWTVVIDRLLVRDGGLRFRDLAVADAAPIDVTLDSAEVAKIALEPSVFGKPVRVRLDLAVDDGRAALRARVSHHPQGLVVAAEARLDRVPLSRTRLYAPALGWSDVKGRLGAQLRYAFTPAGAHTVRGTVALDDVAVDVPNEATPVLTAKRASGTIDVVDLARRRVELSNVALRGATLVVDPTAPQPVPLIAGVSRANAGAAPPAAPAWTVLLKSASVGDATLAVRNPVAPGPLPFDLGVRDVQVPGSKRAALHLALGRGGRQLVFDGTMRLDAVDVEGTLSLQRVALPAVATALGWLPPNRLQLADADGTLRLRLNHEDGALQLSGPASIADLWIAADDPHVFSVGARRVAGRIETLRIPGVVGAAKAGDGARLELGRVTLEAPYAELTRTAAGEWIGPAGDVPRAAPASNDAATPADDAGGPPALRLQVDAIDAAAARVYLVDRTVKPYFVGGLDPFTGEVMHLQWPGWRVEYFRADGNPPERGRVAVRGWLIPEGSQLGIESTDAALLPFNPYVAAITGYSVARGRLSGHGTIWFGPWGWNATPHLVLHDFDLATTAGDSLFRERFGVPLSVALALLRDIDGDIVLDVPVAVDAAGARVGVASVLAGALERALVNALASPLKLVGSVLSSGGEPTPTTEPGPIPFLTGRAEPAAEGEAAIKRLAAFLSGRPGLAVRLLVTATTEDVAWLTEHEAPAVPGPERVRQLVAARLDGLRRTLGERYGLDDERVAARPPSPVIGDGAPVALLQFGPVGDAPWE